MRILVTGAEGQLATALAERARARSGIALTTLGRPKLDIADRASVAAALAATRPDLVVNAAAYTAVDRAETDEEQAHRINAAGAGIVSAAAARAGLAVIHVSTDFVFDGTLRRAWREDDATAPLNVYGRSKLAGEAAVADANPRHLVVRTSWVFAPFGQNFVRTMLRLARERPELRVVADQHGSPTYAPDLAEAILSMASAIVAGGAAETRFGIVHAAGTVGTPPPSWYDLAALTMAEARRCGLPAVPVLPIKTADYPTPARRPAFSVLDTGRMARGFDLRLPDWRDGVRRCVATIAAAEAPASMPARPIHEEPVQ